MPLRYPALRRHVAAYLGIIWRNRSGALLQPRRYTCPRKVIFFLDDVLLLLAVCIILFFVVIISQEGVLIILLLVVEDKLYYYCVLASTIFPNSAGPRKDTGAIRKKCDISLLFSLESLRVEDTVVSIIDVAVPFFIGVCAALTYDEVVR